jgi:hypothetical protein
MSIMTSFRCYRQLVILFLISVIPLVFISTQWNISQVSAQSSLGSSIEGPRMLVEFAIHALQNGFSNVAITQLKLADQQLVAISAPSLQPSKVLVESALQSLQNGDINVAMADLKVADQQLSPAGGKHVMPNAVNGAGGKQVMSNAVNGGSSRYNVIFEGKNYPLNYQVNNNNKVFNITAITAKKTVNINLDSSSNGVLTVVLPRSLIDSKNLRNGVDFPYTVSVDHQRTLSLETQSTAQLRTLKIDFNKGTKQIEIFGSKIGNHLNLLPIGTVNKHGFAPSRPHAHPAGGPPSHPSNNDFAAGFKIGRNDGYKDGYSGNSHNYGFHTSASVFDKGYRVGYDMGYQIGISQSTPVSNCEHFGTCYNNSSSTKSGKSNHEQTMTNVTGNSGGSTGGGSTGGGSTG